MCLDNGKSCDIEPDSSSTGASPSYSISLTLEQEGDGRCGNSFPHPLQPLIINSSAKKVFLNILASAQRPMLGVTLPTPSQERFTIESQ